MDGLLLVIGKNPTYLTLFQNDDAFGGVFGYNTGAWSSVQTEVISTNTASGTVTNTIIPDANGYVYLAAKYRGGPGGILGSTHALPFSSATTYVVTSPITNLVLPYSDMRMLAGYGMHYDGSSPTNTVWTLHNMTAITVKMFAPSTNDSYMATTNGPINLSGVDYTNGVSIISGATKSFIADKDGHYIQL